MRNHLHEILEGDGFALGAQLRFGSASIAELFAAAGFDFVVIDGEHAPQTMVGIQAQLQAVNGYTCTPVVRVGRIDPAEIQMIADMGAGGVLVPLVRTAVDVERFVQACRYPPEGTRSFGPSRAHRYGFDRDYWPRTTPKVLTMVIIETAEAVENIDAILAVDGLDTFVTGPADLSIALGVPLEMQHPKLEAAIEKVLSAAKRTGKPAGVSFSPSGSAITQAVAEHGARLLLGGGDEWILKAGCSELVEAANALRKASAGVHAPAD
jgi:2-keto-3-deoxy-L-rhamnonate aldolase RhmA